MEKLKQAKDLSILADRELNQEHYQKAAAHYSNIIYILSSLLDSPINQSIIVDLKQKIDKYKKLKSQAESKIKLKEQVPVQPSENKHLLLVEGADQKDNTQDKSFHNKNLNRQKHHSSSKKQQLNTDLKRNNSHERLGDKKQVPSTKLPSNNGPSCQKRNVVRPPHQINKIEVPPKKEVPNKKPKDFHIEPEVKDLIIKNIDVTFEDIVGLKDVKSILQQAVIRPRKRPDLYTGIRAPPRGLLLYGPPGNGKTFICKALANQSKCTFFALSASSIMNKYLGQSQKMVKKVFLAAQKLAPSIIFIDEIDSMLTARSEKQHQASRRLKTEFLVLMDGISSPKSGDLIVIGATNLPKQLDSAAKRRFSKFVYIGNPDAEARQQLLLRNLKDIQYTLKKQQIRLIVEKLDCYSASEIRNIMVQVCNQPLKEVSMSKFQKIQSHELRKICFKDFMIVLEDRRPIMSRQQLQKYKQKV